MADEIKARVSLSVTKSNLTLPTHGGTTQSLTMTGSVYAAGSPSIGTGAHEALPMQDVTTAGVAYFRNADSTNYVEVGYDTAGTFRPFLKLKAGEEYVCRLTQNAPYAQANTGAVVLQYLILQD